MTFTRSRLAHLEGLQQGLQRALGLGWHVALGHGVIRALRGYKRACWARSACSLRRAYCAWANGVGERGYLYADFVPMLCILRVRGSGLSG